MTTKIHGFNGRGGTAIYEDFDQWLQDQNRQAAPVKKKNVAREKTQKQSEAKLTYGERLELAAIEEKILEAEEKLEHCRQQLENPAVNSNAEELAKWCSLLQPTQEKVDKLYARWQDLESRT